MNSQLLFLGGIDKMIHEVTDQFVQLGFEDLTDDEDRFNWVRNKGDFQPTSLPKPSTKSARDSEKYRTEGTQYFKAKLYKEACDLYTKSIIAAPGQDADGDEKHLAKCLNNRSAALFHLQEYKACVVDIDGALDAGYPQDKQYLLYIRKVKCLYATHSYAEAELALNKVVELLSKSNMGVDQHNRILEEVEKYKNSSATVSNPHDQLTLMDQNWPLLLDGTSENHPSLSSSCSVMYDREKGRYVVSVKIIPGEIILMEKPFSSLLYQGYSDMYCDYCYRRLSLAPIACQCCTKVLYCSPTCRANAQTTYHNYECSMDKSVYHIGFQYHLALRTVIVAGLDEVLKHKDQSSLLALGQYKSNDFKTIKHLVTHSDKLSTQEMFKITAGAVRCTRYLEQADFFTGIAPEEYEAAILCVGQSLMHIIQAIKVNSAPIKVTVVKGTNITNPEYEDIGVGLYPTYALFNHSCASNSTCISYTNNIALRATRAIKEGEEVTVSYNASYLFNSREKRQEILQQSYHFKCSCEACTKNWPQLNAMRPQVPPLEAALQQSSMKRREAVGLLFEGRINAAFTVMSSEISSLDNLPVSPWQHKEYLLCSATLQQCLKLMGNLQIEEATSLDITEGV